MGKGLKLLLDYYFIFSLLIIQYKKKEEQGEQNSFFIFYYFTGPQSQWQMSRQRGVFLPGGWRSRRCSRVASDRAAGLEVVCHPANRLDVGVLRLPLLVGAVASSLHHKHVASVVGLFIQHPAVEEKCMNSGKNWFRKCSSFKSLEKHCYARGLFFTSVASDLFYGA